MLFNRPVYKITSSKTGTLPPTRPVKPPYGTTASYRELQYFNTRAISSVDPGLSASLEPPFHLRVQSLFKASS